MSQRDSGYQRKKLDNYETPAWVTVALLPYIPARIRIIYEPAAGSGKMVAVLEEHFCCEYDDISKGKDFLKCKKDVSAIVTNPPYALATEFIWHALALTKVKKGFVAMLLRTDFDHAKTRSDLFRECSIFAKKIVLTKRIQWFENSNGSPSFNHAWFIWDWKTHRGPPTLGYGP